MQTGSMVRQAKKATKRPGQLLFSLRALDDKLQAGLCGGQTGVDAVASAGQDPQAA